MLFRWHNILVKILAITPMPLNCNQRFWLTLLVSVNKHFKLFKFPTSFHTTIISHYVQSIQTLKVSTVLLCFTVTALTAAVPELLHGPIHSPETSQIQFSPISRVGINWSVCRSSSLGTLHSTHWPVHASSRNRRKLDLRGLRRMNWTMHQFWTALYYTTLCYI